MPKISPLGQKLWPTGREHTDTQTHTHTDRQTDRQRKQTLRTPFFEIFFFDFRFSFKGAVRLFQGIYYLHYIENISFKLCD